MNEVENEDNEQDDDQVLDDDQKLDDEILVDQITTVSGQALIERVEMLPDEIRIKLRRNLCVVLGFSI